MEICRDYEELFRILNAFKIKYLVVGAYAVIFYSEPRFTKDLDIWISPDLNDSHQVHKALEQFGVPLKGVVPTDFQDNNMILQIGVAPIRVGIMMNVPGVSIEAAWNNRKRTRYGKIPINLLGLQDLIQTKRTAGRLQDQLDIQKLMEHARESSRHRSKKHR